MLKAAGFSLLNRAVRALTGVSLNRRKFETLHGFGTVNPQRVKLGRDGGRLFGSWLTDTVDYYH